MNKTALTQNALTVITRVRIGESPRLDALLTKIGGDIKGNGLIRFDLIGSLHFCCWVLLQEEPGYPAQLVLESNFDGSLDSHLDAWIENGAAGLDAIYGHCEDYPAKGSADSSAVKNYLKKHLVPCPAFYVGCPGQSLPSIRNAIAVRTKINELLDDAAFQGLTSGKRPLEIVQEISKRLKASPETTPLRSDKTIDEQEHRGKRNALLLAWCLVPLLPFVVIYGILNLTSMTFHLALMLIGLGLLPLWLIVVLVLLVYAPILRMKENQDERGPQPAPRPIDPRMFDKEDIFIQNHLTTMVNVKPGAFRLYTLKFVLWAISVLAKLVFITGHLGGIPTIHFARWIMMDNDRRLLFFSNYDGSWASYLGDFVDKANYGLTAVWSNTEAFPPSKWLAFGGAMHIEQFKQWSRQHNVFAAVWYSAYPDETIMNLRNDLQIRDQIDSIDSDEAAKAWLRRL